MSIERRVRALNLPLARLAALALFTLTSACLGEPPALAEGSMPHGEAESSAGSGSTSHGTTDTGASSHADDSSADDIAEGGGESGESTGGGDLVIEEPCFSGCAGEVFEVSEGVCQQYGHQRFTLPDRTICPSIACFVCCNAQDTPPLCNNDEPPVCNDGSFAQCQSAGLPVCSDGSEPSCQDESPSYCIDDQDPFASLVQETELLCSSSNIQI